MGRYLFRAFSLLALSILLLPALVYLTSPWWASTALSSIVKSLWGYDLHLATATYNPFTMNLSGAGGSFSIPADKGIAAGGDMGRLELDLDFVPWWRERRIKEAVIEVSLLTVNVGGKNDVLPAAQPASRASTGREARQPATGADKAPSGWNIDRLSLRIDRALLRYSDGSNRGEISMDLNYSGTHTGVTGSHELWRRILQDLFTKAAYGFLTERLFR